MASKQTTEFLSIVVSIEISLHTAPRIEEIKLSLKLDFFFAISHKQVFFSTIAGLHQLGATIVT